MKLYFLPDEHRYVHRMADVPKGTEPKIVEVPTDLAGLMGFLNELWAAHQIDLDNAFVQIDDDHMGKLHTPAPGVLGTPPTSGTAVMPPPAVEQQLTVEEAIQNADAIALGRYADNVCHRIKELLP